MTGGQREDLPAPSSALDDLFDRLVVILDRARNRVVRSVNSEMVLAYWHIGREIVQIRQNGEARAAYGVRLLEGDQGQRGAAQGNRPDRHGAPQHLRAAGE